MEPRGLALPFPIVESIRGSAPGTAWSSALLLRSEKLTRIFFLIFLRIPDAGGMQYGRIMLVIIRMHLGGGNLCDFPSNFWCSKLSHKQSGELSRYFALQTVAS